VTIGGLVPSLTYGVAVATNTEFGTGTFSDAITVGRKFVDSNLLNVKNFIAVSEYSRFQLFFTGAIDCQQWVVSCLVFVTRLFTLCFKESPFFHSSTM
jgi:hypothetical protein